MIVTTKINTSSMSSPLNIFLCNTNEKGARIVSNKKKQDNEAIGVGPFMVPGIVSFGFEANILNIVLENPTKRNLSATVKVDQSPNSDDPQVPGPVFPDTDSQKTILRQPVTLPPTNYTIVAVPISPLKIYYVTISGDVGVAGHKKRGIMASILGGVKTGDGNDRVLFPEPTLCFDYEKFVKVEDFGEDEDIDD
jgi:hypothetical protein